MRSIMLKWRPWVIPDKARPRTPSKSKDPKGSDVSWEAPMNSMLAHKLPIQTSSFKKTPVILGGKLPQERTFAMSKFRLLYAQVQVHCNVYRNFVYACIRKKITACTLEVSTVLTKPFSLAYRTATSEQNPNRSTAPGTTLQPMQPSGSPVPKVTVSWSRCSLAPAVDPSDCMFLGSGVG